MPQTVPDTQSGSPTVSVISPACNVAPYIAEAVNSVFAQTFTDYELIVVNHGSPDTEKLEHELAPFLDRIVYLKTENNGVGAACNAALKVARGKYVAFLDADDAFLPNHLSEQLALIESGQGYDLVYADATTFGELATPGRTVMDDNPSDGEVTFSSLLEGKCSAITTTVLARREALLEVGLFDESLGSSQDLDLWLRLAKRSGARMSYQRKALAAHRIYEAGLAADDLGSLEDEVTVLTKASRRSDLTPAEQDAIKRTMPKRRAVIEAWRGKERLRDGNFAGAIESFSESNSLVTNRKLQLVILSLKIAPRLFQRIYGTRAA
jgi:glycosyltransferase involved in cell wall biosynthesis